MATFLTRFSPFCQDFRHFLVSARGKLGLNSFCAASFFFGWNGLAVIVVSRRRRSHFPMVLGCTSRTQKRAEDCLTRSAQRHRTTPSLSSSGPLITTSRSASAWLGV